MRRSMGLENDEQFVFHLLRHESVSRMVDKGKDAFAIQAYHGHASIVTTQVYVKVSLGAMQRAIAD